MSDPGGKSEPPEPEPEPTRLSKFLKTIELLHPLPDPANDTQEIVDSNSILGKWYIITLAQLVYIAVFLPIRIGFRMKGMWPWILFDILFDIVHFVDIWVKMRTAVEDNGFFITEKPRIRRKYARSVFGGLFFDVITGIPVDYFLMGFLSYDPVFRVNRLLRLFYTYSYFRLFEQFNPNFSTNKIRLLKAGFKLMFVAHLLGCGFSLVLEIEGEETDRGDPQLVPSGGRTFSWQGYYGWQDLPIQRRYIRSLYWAFILMTGYGNTIPIRTIETLYTILVTLVGLSVYVHVIGTVSSLVANLDATSEAHRTKMDTINDWMRYRRLPADIQHRVKAYYDYMWETRKGVDERTLLSDLPTYLRLELSEFVNKDIIQKVPLFKDVSKAFMNAVILHLQPRVVLKGAYICRVGDVGAEMFFISSGCVNVVAEKDGGETTVLATLTDGCFFGEVALIYQTKRTATVVAHTTCELYILKKVHFEEVLDEFSDYAKAILEKAAERFGSQAENAKLRRVSRQKSEAVQG
eukprot:TRINITY_DN8796_c1_g1_i1.p1 TRINITY_DN8796_c1_g1~~TRINITY_DN8796_c1_g1_i1.p1  ORF type:complete len:520 (+),score=65.76 TRINITY_DN8796_c1_g1_i1:45-1604(+)